MSTATAADSEEPGAQAKAAARLDLSLVQFGAYNGMMMTYFENNPLEVHVPKVMKLSLRDTDIILLTYPKSGTHWVWRALDMLAKGSATYSGRYHPGIFFPDLVPTEVIDRISPDVRRVLSTHYTSDLLPAQVKDGRVKVVHVYRHPKAVLVSMLFQMRDTGRFPDLTLDELEAILLEEKGPFKNQFYYLDKLQEYERDNPNVDYERDNPNVDIFHLAYEDMTKDTVGCIKQLAAHLNVDASDELCSNIAEAVSFSGQKKHEESADEQQKALRFFRKGQADDWKNHMTVAQSQRMDKVVADRTASCQFCRRYCPAITTDQGHVYRLSPAS